MMLVQVFHDSYAFSQAFRIVKLYCGIDEDAGCYVWFTVCNRSRFDYCL